MSYGKRYVVLFDSFQSDVKIYINDTDTYTEDSVTPIDTEVEGHSFSITIDDTDEDKGTPIRARKAGLRILSNASLGLTDFVFGDDDRWYVEIYIDGVIKFMGYIIVDESSQEFLPNESKCIIELVATDNLGLLKDMELRDTNDTVPLGYYSFIQFISWCLVGTTLELPIVVAQNLYEEDYNRDDHAIFEEIYANSLTFEKAIGERVSRYETLTKILSSFQCYLTQFEGKWWIIRVDELTNDLLYTCEFTSDGVLSSIGTGIDTKKLIGVSENLYFSQGATTYKFKRAAKFVKQTFNYETPREIIINQDFSRGDFSSPESGIGFIAYTPEGWIYKKGWPNVQQDSNGYIKVTLDEYDNEDERYLHMPPTNDNDFYYWQPGNLIPVGLNDKFEIGIDFRHSDDLGGGSGHFELSIMQIRLHGEDGTKWFLRATSPESEALDSPPVWRQSNTDFTINQSNINYEGDSGTVDFTTWQNVTITSAPVPVAGDIEVFLVNNFTTNSQSKSFQNFRFDYIPFIYGSYKKYKGQYHKVEQDGTLKSNVEEIVSFSDSPRKLFNGAMFKFEYLPGNSYTGLNITASNNGIAVVGPGVGDYRAGQRIKLIGATLNNKAYTIDRIVALTSSWIEIYTVEDLQDEVLLGSTEIRIGYARLTEGWSDTPAPLGITTFGKYQVFALWNQHRREMAYFEYTMQGAEGETTIPDVAHKFELSDAHLATNNKTFMMLTFDMDINSAEYSGMLAECHDSDLGKDYDSDYEFKYIEA